MTNPGFAGIINLAFAGVAHLVERDLAKVEVASSSLVARSKRHHLRRWCFFFLPFGAHRRAGLQALSVTFGDSSPRGRAKCVRPAALSGPQKKAGRVARPTVGQRGIADKRRRGLCAPRPTSVLSAGVSSGPLPSAGRKKRRAESSAPTVGQRGIADKRRRGLCAPPPFLCACHITAARALARAA